MHTHVVVDELGHVIGRRDSQDVAYTLACQYSDNPRIRGKFEPITIDERAYRNSEFVRIQQAHEAKHMLARNEDSWGFTRSLG